MPATGVQDDIELEPRFNLGTESLSAGVTWKVGANSCCKCYCAS